MPQFRFNSLGYLILFRLWKWVLTLLSGGWLAGWPTGYLDKRFAILDARNFDHDENSLRRPPVKRNGAWICGKPVRADLRDTVKCLLRDKLAALVQDLNSVMPRWRMRKVGMKCMVPMLVCAATMALGAWAQKVDTKLDESYDFSEHKTYKWRENRLMTQQNPDTNYMMDKKIVRIVNETLKSRGFVEVHDNPCRLRWSTQHWLAVYLRESGILTFFGTRQTIGVRDFRPLIPTQAYFPYLYSR